MDNAQIGFIGFLALLVLIALRVPVAIALALVGTLGLYAIGGIRAAFTFIAVDPFSTIYNIAYTTVPLFLLMGYFAYYAGLSQAAFDFARMLLNWARGGLAMATVAACALFGAVSGSGVAAAAAMGRITVPEMLRYNYDKRLATGVVASSATLAVLIPPSILLIIYAVYTEQSVGQLFIAGYIPGLLSAAIYMIMIYLRVTKNPELAPRVEGTFSWAELRRAARDMWGVAVLALLVLVGIYAGWFTATEAAAVGAFGTLIIALLRRRMTWTNFKASLFDTAQTTAMFFLLIIGASLFSRFIVLSGFPRAIVSLVLEYDLPAWGFLAAISAVYIFLGMFLEGISMMLLTLPVLLPALIQLDINLIWFGIIVVKLAEIGAITPPFGVTVYVIKSVLQDKVELEEIFAGIWWFLLMDILTLALLIAFPGIVLWLPTRMR